MKSFLAFCTVIIERRKEKREKRKKQKKNNQNKKKIKKNKNKINKERLRNWIGKGKNEV